MKNIRTVECAQLGERVVMAEHESGLQLMVCEKPEFTGAYAIFGTRYGSVDNAFRLEGEEEFTRVPDGIAHFLEHKLFESEDGDAFSRYAETGASANAYTSFDRTCYLFSCSDHFEDSFRILLDFVQSPYFTPETVQKEQGIIGQEISMYDDSPDWRLLTSLFEAMYENNPIRVNIAGTAESISHITADLLHRCYRTFYNLNNMFIAVAGNVSSAQVMALCDELLRPSQPVKFERGPYEEPDGVLQPYAELAMAVSRPQFALGFKEPCHTPFLSVRERIITDLAIDLIAGPQSELYERLLREGLINQQFSAGLFDGYNFRLELFSGESDRPQQVAEEIKKEIARVQSEGFSSEEFNRVKRLHYGRYLMSFNSVESVADSLTECCCTGAKPFEAMEVYRTLTVEDLNAAAKACFAPEGACLSVVYPLNSAKGGKE